MPENRPYVDAEEMIGYVWDHYRRLMTAFERRVGMAWLAEQEARIGKPEVGQAMLRSAGLVGNAEADAALAGGIDAFRDKVRDRLLKEHAAEVFVNRCPRCNRIVRTPKARQCLWCGHDWHNSRDSML